MSKKGACFSQSRGSKFENFLARRAQPWWALLRHCSSSFSLYSNLVFAGYLKNPRYAPDHNDT